MKILFIVPYVPNLIRVRPYNLIRHLAAQGHQVTLATLWTSEQERQDLAALNDICSEVLAFRLPRWRSLFNSFRALPGPSPLQSAYCWTPDLANELTRRLTRSSNGADSGFDVIHVEHLRGVVYGLALQQAMGERPIPVVWDSVDSISYLFHQAAQHNPRWWMRALFRLEARRTERFEAKMLRQFPQVLVTSNVDREAFLDLDPAGKHDDCLTVLPNGVDLDYFQPGPAEQREPASVVVSGKMSYHANINMALRLVREIMPLVWQSQPAVNVWIVGKDPPPAVQELAQDPRVTVTGTVPDLRPYLQKATAAIAPLSYGAGIQNKVLEAMACATPVIASSQSVAALPFIQPGKDVLTAEDHQSFAQQMLVLLGDRALQARLGAAGYRYVVDHHHWRLITKRLEEIYQKTIFG